MERQERANYASSCLKTQLIPVWLYLGGLVYVHSLFQLPCASLLFYFESAFAFNWSHIWKPERESQAHCCVCAWDGSPEGASFNTHSDVRLMWFYVLLSDCSQCVIDLYHRFSVCNSTRFPKKRYIILCKDVNSHECIGHKPQWK